MTLSYIDQGHNRLLYTQTQTQTQNSFILANQYNDDFNIEIYVHNDKKIDVARGTPIKTNTCRSHRSHL